MRLLRWCFDGFTWCTDRNLTSEGFTCSLWRVNDTWAKSLEKESGSISESWAGHHGRGTKLGLAASSEGLMCVSPMPGEPLSMAVTHLILVTDLWPSKLLLRLRVKVKVRRQGQAEPECGLVEERPGDYMSQSLSEWQSHQDRINTVQDRLNTVQDRLFVWGSLRRPTTPALPEWHSFATAAPRHGRALFCDAYTRTRLLTALRGGSPLCSRCWFKAWMPSRVFWSDRLANGSASWWGSQSNLIPLFE